MHDNCWSPNCLLKDYHIILSCKLVMFFNKEDSTNPITKILSIHCQWTNTHQCNSLGWGRSSHFADEPKTHPPLPKVFDFVSFFFTPKFFLPTYLPPTYLTSFFVHSIVKAWESLKWEGKTRNQKWEGKIGN